MFCLAGSACISGVTTEDGTCMVLPEYAIRSGPRREIYWDASQVLYPACLKHSAVALFPHSSAGVGG